MVSVLPTRSPGASGTQGIVAMYDVTTDWTPIYDKSALPGYYMAIGTSGNQFKNAGPVGKLMAALVVDGEGFPDSSYGRGSAGKSEGGDGVGSSELRRDQDTDPLMLPMERSGLGYIDTSSFSRLRQAKDIGNVIG